MVAVKAHEADRFLSSPDRAIRIFLFYGPDQGLIGERAQVVARASVSDPDDPFQLVRIDGAGLSGDPMRLVDEANTIGLFGGKRAIWVSVSGKFPMAAIEPLLATPPVDAVVVLEAGDLAKTSPLRLAIERSRTSVAIPCYSDDARGLDTVIDAVCREFDVTIDRDARLLLSTRIGVDRRVSRREIEKLATYAGASGKVEVADVDAIVGDASARDVDDVVDGVFSGSVNAMDLAFRRLCSAGEDSGVLLGFVIRHAQSLLAVRDGIDRGVISVSDATKSMRGITYLRKSAVEKALSRWSSLQLTRTITTLHSVSAQVRFNPALSEELASRALWNLCLGGGRS